MKFRTIMLILVAFTSCHLKAQDIAIHNNVLCDAVGNMSIGAEFALKPRTTIEVYGGIRPWKSTDREKNKYWFAEGQYRFWGCQKYNGFYYGPYVAGGEYNIGGTTPLFGLPKATNDSRYEGWLLGIGMGVGYEYAVSHHWNVGAEVGAGYTLIDYKKFDCGECGSLDKKGRYNYWGLSKLGLNIIYIF